MIASLFAQYLIPVLAVMGVTIAGLVMRLKIKGLQGSVAMHKERADNLAAKDKAAAQDAQDQKELAMVQERRNAEALKRYHESPAFRDDEL